MRREKKYTICGETLTLREFAEKYKIRKRTLKSRIELLGIPEEYLLLPPGKVPRGLIKNEISDVNKQHNMSLSWTKSALDCYDIGANCARCYLPLDIQKRCQMAQTIKEIVRQYGKPYDRTEERNFIEEV